VQDLEVKALLDAVKDGVEATAVGIIDGGRGWLHLSSERSPGSFWAAFTRLDCLRGAWGEWDQELLASGAAGILCRCGGHSVQTRMVHTRWILVVLCEGPLVAGAEKVVEHAAQVLQGLLPLGLPPQSSEPPDEGGPVGGPGGGPGGGGQGPAELGIPVAWIRRRRPD